MTSFIAKCKTCKAVRQLSAEVADSTEVERDARGRVSSSMRVAWRVVGGVNHGCYSRLSSRWNGRWQIAMRCSGCGKTLDFTGVDGEWSHDTCSAKCTSATGHDCQCSCAGENHGEAHAA